MARAEQVEVRARIVIEHPVVGVLHSLQQDDAPLGPQRSQAGDPLAFEVPLRVAAGSKFFGPQVRREGPERRFVYIRVGACAGDRAAPWTRRMKIDIHDVDPALVERARAGAVLEATINGTLADGSPACATIRPVIWRAV